MTSPQDTLQGYFDELLVSDAPDVEESLLSSASTSTPHTPATHSDATEAPFGERQLEPEKMVEPDVKPLMKDSDAQQLARQKLAKLLTSAPPKPAPPEVVQVKATAIKPTITVSTAPAQVSVAADVEIVEPQTDTKVALAQKVDTEVEEQQDQRVDVSPQSTSELHWAENGRPQWAQERFEVLLFEVAGLTLAVPLISLGQIQPLTDELTPLFGQADWFMGLLPTSGGKIRTINTAKFVMPERYQDSFLEAARYVVSINGLPWGLAVDAVNQPITLQPDDVKWRSERGKRPWLAGTVKEHMCALLDVATMGELLSAADKSGSKQDPLTDNL